MPTRISRRAAALSLLPPALGPFRQAFGQLISRDDYLRALGAALNQILSQSNGRRQFPLIFSANLFFAHEAVIANIPLSTLSEMVRAFADAGVQRVDINTGIWPWAASSSDPQAAATIEKYDAVVQQIRSAGLSLAINPQYTALFFRFDSFDSWAAAARGVYRTVTERYRPEIFVIVHEPSTMAARLGENVSTERWKAFIEQVAADIDQVSPVSRLGAGGLFTEESAFNAFLDIAALDVMTIDVYSYGILGAHFSAYERMTARARTKGKSVYIEETWRPPYFDLGAGLSLDQAAAAGVGEQVYAEADAKWITAVAQWAATLGLEAITPFWTQTFFHYEDGEAGGLDPAYNAAVIEAVGQGRRTPTFEAARTAAARLGAQILPASSASFQSGALGAGSIVSIFPFRGRTLAATTETAPSVPLPTVLAGVSVEVIDSAGASRQAGIIFASPGQINCVFPAASATGSATVTVRGSGVDITGLATIVASSPALYSANASGQGIAAAVALRRTPAGQDVSQVVFTPSPVNPLLRVGVPIDFGGSQDRVFLLLFGTGFRNASNIQVNIDGSPAALLFSGAQGEFEGLDQANVELDRRLRGRGEVTVRLTADNRLSNTVTLLV